MQASHFLHILGRSYPGATLFPYTTLFRSAFILVGGRHHGHVRDGAQEREVERAMVRSTSRSRSEEHTSELQSRRDLVCRLLLEKKNSFCAYTWSFVFLREVAD